VLSSGLGGTYPKGLLIGHVEQVSLDDSGLFQRALIRPAADLGRLPYCFVVRESRDPVEVLLRQAPVNGGGAEP
jgi:rod shape-determining protein MreC